MKKILICGASGMVGRTVVSEALSNHVDCEIWAADLNVDVFSGLEDTRLHPILNKDLESVMQETHFNAMLQMAFPRNVQPDKWASGIDFCFEMLFLAQKYNVDKVVHVSSQSLYGWQREERADEQSPVMLVSPYTTGKYCAELLTYKLFKEGTFTNVRLSTIIGPLTKERVVNKLVDHVLSGEDIVIQGGSQIFSFLDVRDAANGLLSIMLKNEIPWRRIYNLGTSESYSLLEIAQSIIETGKQLGYSKSNIILQQQDIVLNNKIDVSSIFKDFGWKAQFNLADSIKLIFNNAISDKKL